MVKNILLKTEIIVKNMSYMAIYIKRLTQQVDINNLTDTVTRKIERKKY